MTLVANDSGSCLTPQEPELLKADGDRVKRQMQEVAVSHYRAFITAAQAVQSIRAELSAIDNHLGSLVSRAPDGYSTS